MRIRGKNVDWDKYNHLFYDGLTDKEIAETINRPEATVRSYRIQNKIPVVHKCRRKGKTKEPKYDWKKADAMWGNATDKEIANIMGCDRKIISSHRSAKKIPCFKKSQRIEKLLGTMSDKEVADRLGIKPNTLTIYRIRHGIGAHRSGEEAALQKRFVESLSDSLEYVRTPGGIIDVLTDKYVYELKVSLDNVSCLHSALGQILIYSSFYPDRKRAIVCQKNHVSQEVLDILSSFDVELIIFGE